MRKDNNFRNNKKHCYFYFERGGELDVLLNNYYKDENYTLYKEKTSVAYLAKSLLMDFLRDMKNVK